MLLIADSIWFRFAKSSTRFRNRVPDLPLRRPFGNKLSISGKRPCWRNIPSNECFPLALLWRPYSYNCLLSTLHNTILWKNAEIALSRLNAFGWKSRLKTRTICYTANSRELGSSWNVLCVFLSRSTPIWLMPSSQESVIIKNNNNNKMHSLMNNEPDWPNCKALGSSAEMPRFNSTSVFLSSKIVLWGSRLSCDFVFYN